MDRLRSGAARAVWGPAKSMAVPLSLTTGIGGLVDPAVFQLSQALVQLQRLLHTWPDLGAETLQRAVEAQGNTSRPYGPATALARLLERSGFTLSSQAVVKGPGHVWIDVKLDPPKIIRRNVALAWTCQVPKKLEHRQGLLDMNPPATETFKACCRPFSNAVLQHLALPLFGGFQSKAAQSVWDPFETEACRFCGQLDTKAHRVWDCPAQSHVRKPFEKVLQWAREHAPHWPYSAVPVAHGDEGVLRLVFNTRRVSPSPAPVPLVCRFALPYCHFYTDGSCAYPSCAPARHAAFSVVLD